MKGSNASVAVLSVVLAVVASAVTAEFNLSRAETGLFLSKIAYCNIDDIRSWTCGACPKFPRATAVTAYTDTFGDSQGYVAYFPDRNEIAYAFRGTVDLSGWVEDGLFFQTPYLNPACVGCLVHEGLYSGYRTLSAVLLPSLQNVVNLHPDADIIIAGHSMGAAHAAFAFPDVLVNIKNSTGTKRLYNFGCPRVGNPAWVKWLEDTLEPRGEHFRATNFGDPVPHLPPIIFDALGLGDWLHAPREVFFMNPFVSPSAPGNMKICAGNTTSEDPTCADSTPIWDLFDFRNHTTYLNHGLGCFL